MPAKTNLSKPLPVEQYALTAQDKKRFAEEKALGMADPTDPLLSKTCRPVPAAEINSPKIQAVAQHLLQIAKDQKRSNQQNRKRRTLVGLAAPQIGEPLRMIVVDTKATRERKGRGKLECFINPQIVWRSRETEEDREGCFSAGPVWGVVRRPIAVKLRAYTPEGKQTERIFEGFTARIVQHESDHLDGVRFADRIISDRKRHWVHTEEIDLYKHTYKHWPRLCTRERWEAYKKSGSN